MQAEEFSTIVWLTELKVLEFLLEESGVFTTCVQ
jgi:hypothetical protein